MIMYIIIIITSVRRYSDQQNVAVARQQQNEHIRFVSMCTSIYDDDYAQI